MSLTTACRHWETLVQQRCRAEVHSEKRQSVMPPVCALLARDAPPKKMPSIAAEILIK